MKIKHHSVFINLDSDEINWDTLRNDPAEINYFIPSKKDDFIEICNKGINKAQIQIIDEILKKYNIKKIFSLGSGRSCLEYNLKMLNYKIKISDKSDSINILKKFKIFDKIYNCDFFQATKFLSGFDGLVLMSRIDTELKDSELKKLFRSLRDKSVKYILFIPAQQLNFKTLFYEIYIRLKSFILRKKMIFCGYSRTFNSYRKTWENFYFEEKFFGFYLLKLR
ncbi:MAG: hypothetical protein CMC91_03850 [Flavobacteriaceae bacterium]|nr:hypothetical protein [Flavobacteriaceae bacterium]|tara:strand:- start:5920 stop:6588 length:669 start_codon:yes stop_codon:yes gene_type:complete